MSSNVNPAVGIDLGTTNTVVAVQTGAMGPELLPIPQPVSERRRLENIPNIKSTVFFEDEQSVVVGAFASTRMKSFRSIKSHMGTRWRGRHPCGTEFLTPAYVSAHILKLAHQTVADRYPDWDRTALITVPASFNTDQRNDTIIAATMAGFRNVRLLDEPTAAFYYFFNQHRDSGTFRNLQNVLVFDFGGGTLDVSIICVQEQPDHIVLDTIGRSRYNNLGGDDIDLELASFMLGCWEFENGKEVTSFARELKLDLYQLLINKASLFKEEVEDYIRNESGIPEFIIHDKIHGSGKKALQIKFRRTLSLDQYETVTGKFFQPKNEVNIYRPIEEAIAVAGSIRPGFSRDKLDLILYTGGASRMRAVQRALKAYFPEQFCTSIDEEEACNTVALGAACCRYDEVYGKRNVKMIIRLLEGIFTRLPGKKQYTTIVPLTSKPSEEYTPIQPDFHLERPSIKLRFPLFRGVSPNDHQLSPMRDLQIPLDQVMERGTRYAMYYRMTENKTVDLKVVLDGPNGPVEAAGKLELFDNVSSPTLDKALCRVNAT